MAQIDVHRIERGDQYEFQVTVRDSGGQSQHRVTLTRDDYHRFAGDQATPAKLVEESFRFLLEREPKESILRSFDLTVIDRYFPEYEREIRNRLQAGSLPAPGAI
jgi:hypothetical protein